MSAKDHVLRFEITELLEAVAAGYPSQGFMLDLHTHPGRKGSKQVELTARESGNGPRLVMTLLDDEAADADGDVSDDADNCPQIANPDQVDTDSDGFGDLCDGCPVDPEKIVAGVCGCGTADIDSDLEPTIIHSASTCSGGA